MNSRNKTKKIKILGEKDKRFLDKLIKEGKEPE